MAVIKPTLTLTANANTATTDAGPASIALSLSATPTDGTSTVTDFQTTIYETTTAHVSVYTHTDDQKVWVYLKNLETTAGASQDIYVGDANADLTASGGEDNRLLTLSAGDFAFFPMSGRKDLYVEGASAGDKLEIWIFKKS
jgi:hypothetical protein